MILKTSKDLAALAADAITGAVWFARAPALFVFALFATLASVARYQAVFDTH